MSLVTLLALFLILWALSRNGKNKGFENLDDNYDDDDDDGGDNDDPDRVPDYDIGDVELVPEEEKEEVLV